MKHLLRLATDSSAPSGPRTDAVQQELRADAITITRGCDIVLGTVMIALAVIGTFWAITGETQIWIAVLLWAVPVLNIAWSHLTRGYARSYADALRSVVNLPIAAAIYGGAAGPLHHLWTPALVTAIGMAVVHGIATRRARFGQVGALCSCAALPLGAALAGEVMSFAIVEDSAAVAICGIMVALVASKLGGSLEEARARRSEAEASRAEVERTLCRLADAQQQLVQTARAAGMAEIATSVLHNVGNVLNSVGVAAELATATLADSRLTSLQKGVELLRTHSDDLPGFVATQQGRMVPEFLSKATAAVAEAVTRASAELSTLRQHVEHIKVVIASQQAHARTTICTETFELLPVVETALDVGGSERGSEPLEVRQSITDVPLLTTDRHKLLQILINLVGNARHAVRDAGVHPGSVVIEARLRSPELLRIEVRDNGVGIDDETMAKLFRHGFTTRVGGHGFGLHSSANAASELGGSLHAHSAGPGCGATFVLEIPVHLQASERLAA
jgi:signal transduction histidine kinase